MQTKVKKWGNSLGLRIPSVYVDELKFYDGNVVDIKITKDNLVIKPVKFNYNLQELLSKITSKNIHEAIDTGTKRGKEVW